MESAAQENLPVKTMPSWDKTSVDDEPSSPVFIKNEPSDGSVEVKASSLDVSVKEEIIDESSCSNGTEPPLEVTVKVERVKEEWCGVSAAAAAAGLYAGHAVTGELVLGPVAVERREAISTDKGRGPQEGQGQRHNTYRCEHCDYTTARKAALVGHMRKHMSMKLCCENCDYTSENKALLRKHFKMHSYTKSYKCVNNKNDLPLYKKKPTEKPYKCVRCNYAATYRYLLTQHERIHTGEKPYKCVGCNYAAAYRHLLTQHERIHTGEKPYKCVRCNYAAAYRHLLTQHERTHTGVKPYKCVRCNYAAAYRHHLTRHEIIHTGKKYECGQCSYATAFKNHLSVHERNHNGEKKYKCGQCSHATAYKRHLLEHERLHTGEKPYKCGQCGYATRFQSALLVHERKHTGEKKYKCGQCRYVTVRLSRLICHKRKHTGEKQYSAHEKNLRIHEGIHSGDGASSTASLTNSGARDLIDHDHTYARPQFEPTIVKDIPSRLLSSVTRVFAK